VIVSLIAEWRERQARCKLSDKERSTLPRTVPLK
jgi:hypothetical protein